MKSGEKSKHPPLAEKSKIGDEKFHLIGIRKLGVKPCTCEGAHWVCSVLLRCNFWKMDFGDEQFLIGPPGSYLFGVTIGS